MARLVVREGAGAGTSCRLPAEEGRITLGRRKGVGLPVPDAKASRDHAEVAVEDGLFILRDLHSRNGTYLDGRKITGDEILEPGATIGIGSTLIELEEDHRVPEGLEISGFRLMECVGRGRRGAVYKARQVSMDRLVAVKVLNERYSNDRAFVRRFTREAREAAKLSHLNVIRVFDAGVAGEVRYFTMEYVDGTTLSRVIRRKGHIGVDRGLGIIRQAARALQHAHENGIIHRDMKPASIMVAGDDLVKVADLGISKAFDDSAGATGLYGTPHYMSPEQAQGAEVDVRTDVYSLGATAYHMLTGEVPFAFERTDPRGVAKTHTTAFLPPVQDVEHDIPDSVALIVERMMARDRDKRYPSMAKLLEDLDKVIANREAKVERIAPGESSVGGGAEGRRASRDRKKVKRAARRRPIARKTGSAAGVGIAIGIGVVAVVGLAFLLALAGSRPERPRRKSSRRAPARDPEEEGGFRGLLFGGGTDYDRERTAPRAAGSVDTAAKAPGPAGNGAPPARGGAASTSGSKAPPPATNTAPQEGAGSSTLPSGVSAPESPEDRARAAISRTVRIAGDAPSAEPAGAPPPLRPRVLVATYVGGAGDQKITGVGFTDRGGIYAKGEGFTVFYDAVGFQGRIEGDVGRHDSVSVRAKPPLPRGTGKEVRDPRSGQTYRVGCRQVSPTLQQPFLVSSAGWSLWGWSHAYASERGLTADTRAYDVWPVPGGRIMAMAWCDGGKSTLTRDPRDLDRPAAFLQGDFRPSPGRMATLFVLINAKDGTPLAGRFVSSHVMHHAVDPWGRVYLPKGLGGGPGDSLAPFSPGNGRAGVAVLAPDLSRWSFGARLGGMAEGEEGREEFGHIALKGNLLVLGGTTAAGKMPCVNPVQERPGGGQDGLVVIIRLWE